MGKQSKKAMKQSVINEVAKQYKDRYKDEIENYRKLLKETQEELKSLRQTNRELYNRNNELSEKCEKYEDWNRRLQEFLDMPAEEREQAIKEYKTNKTLDNAISNLFGTFFFPEQFNTLLSLYGHL